MRIAIACSLIVTASIMIASFVAWFITNDANVGIFFIVASGVLSGQLLAVKFLVPPATNRKNSTLD